MFDEDTQVGYFHLLDVYEEIEKVARQIYREEKNKYAEGIENKPL